MRYYLYIMSGIASALIGWFVSSVILIGFGQTIEDGILPLSSDFMAEFVILPLVAACLAVAMVVTEIYLSHPTRHRENKQVLLPYIIGGVLTGIGAGLIAAAATWIIYQTPLDDNVKIVAWSLIGLFIGLSEGASWRFRSIEGTSSKAKQRLWKSTLYGFIAGLTAAIILKLLKQGGIELQGYEEPFGFFILGLSLGLSLSFATRPAYQVALRAGRGFEEIDPKYRKSQRVLPKLNKDKSGLKFVLKDDDDDDIIEEGLSIQLPANPKKAIIIGSHENADIKIPHLPEKCASLLFETGQWKLKCLAEGAVKLRKTKLSRNDKEILRHNSIFTLYNNQEKNKKVYSFVFYDRFLDPQA